MKKKPVGPIGHRWYSPEEFRALLEAKTAVPNDVAIRAYAECEAVEKAEGDGGRTLRFTVSTAAVDRQRDTISQDGWKLDNYLKNPVVLWAHDYSGLPIARATAVRLEGGKLVAEAKFCDPETYPFADTVYKMLLAGYLRATSVGFTPLKYAWNEERRGADFMEQELLEFSVVPVPANPEALMAASAAGIDLRPLKGWVVEVLKHGGEEFGLTEAQLLEMVSTLEKAAPPVAQKADPNCPMGDGCPYEQGMEHCPAGECPMKRAADKLEVKLHVTLADFEALLAPIREQLAKLARPALTVEEQLAALLAENGVVLELAPAEEPIVLELGVPEDAVLDIDEDDLQAALQAAITEGLKGAVQQSIDKLRGRLT